MTEKKEGRYPLIVWFYYQNERKLITDVNFDHSENKEGYIEKQKAFAVADAIKMVHFDVPVEVSLLTQSSSTPTAIEVVRVNGIDIHTQTKEAAVFVLENPEEDTTSKNFDFREISQSHIRKLFRKQFADFRNRHKYAVSEERRLLMMEVNRCNKVYKVLYF